MAGTMEICLTDRALPEKLPTWGVLVLESHHSSSFTMEWRTHTFLKVVYVLSGRGTFYLGERSEPFQRGDVILVAPGTRNRIEDDPASASSLYVCCIEEHLISFDPSLRHSLGTQVIRNDVRFGGRIASLLRRIVHAQETQHTSRPVAMVADALRLIQAVCEREEKFSRNAANLPPERLAVQQYIESLPTRFFEETSIDDAASQLGIPRRSFTKLFAELAGETWLQHIRRLAISHAQKRLLQTDLSITSIAFECGFNDLSTFYRQFKAQSGLSPGEYREQNACADAAAPR
jgi:AraC-like DNA-binding protein